MPSSVFNMPLSTSSISPKIHFTHSELSSKYLDPSQPPTKAVPFRQITGIPFVKDLKICMPNRLLTSLYPDNGSDTTGSGGPSLLSELRFSKMTMTLKDVLDDEALRRGNYLLLSTPEPPSSNSTTISLNCGKLTINMPHHIYQRAGLTFPEIKVPSGGRKHNLGSGRHRIEMDLRQPSMVKGKKGFDRLMYTAKNVEGLSELRVWIFYDLSDLSSGDKSINKKRKRDESDARTAANPGQSYPRTDTGTSKQGDTDNNTDDAHPYPNFNPKVKTMEGVKSIHAKALVPSFIRKPSLFSTIQPKAAAQQSQRANIPSILEEDIHDVVEYLSLVLLQSTRITKAEYGNIDPYLCQYVLPDLSSSSATKVDSDDPSKMVERERLAEDLSIVSYSGFIPSAFVTQILVDMIRRSRSAKKSWATGDANAWAALSVVAHPTEVTGGSDGLMVLLQVNDVADDDSVDDADEGVGEGTGRAVDQDKTRGQNQEQSASAVLRGFQYVSCFEFVDSMTG